MPSRAFFELSYTTLRPAANEADTVHVPLMLPCDYDIQETSKHTAAGINVGADTLICDILPDAMLDFERITDRDYKNIVSLIENHHPYFMGLLGCIDRFLYRLQKPETHSDPQTRKEIRSLVQDAITPIPLPPFIEETEQKADHKDKILLRGGLHFSTLEQSALYDLVHAYLNLKAMEGRFDRKLRESLAFAHILQDQQDAFLALYGGYHEGGKGAMSSEFVMLCAHRAHHYEQKLQSQDYSERGRRAASSLAFSSFGHLIEAWILCEKRQRQTCLLIETIMRHFSLKKIPKWARHDTFVLLEREAMKHVYADKIRNFVRQNPQSGLKILAAGSLFMLSLNKSEKTGIDADLHQFINYLLSPHAPYQGEAESFITASRQRMREYENHRDAVMAYKG